MNLEDYLSIFRVLDYDNKDSVDFFKFCMLNTDKQRDTHNFLKQLKYEQTLG